ncbi:hypothetical protein BpHYR1_040919 [Brachionus plicatilis]|uniref:Uncharacterized protein n=1 Tax=Brachionus plicatilis TaxID=10195 RepID=A0A3M7SHW8_BRAPC|nr:hypothetical protein BpHYR1_040919 [Brachionus plicatilis]
MTDFVIIQSCLWHIIIMYRPRILFISMNAFKAIIKIIKTKMSALHRNNLERISLKKVITVSLLCTQKAGEFYFYSAFSFDLNLNFSTERIALIVFKILKKSLILISWYKASLTLKMLVAFLDHFF